MVNRFAEAPLSLVVVANMLDTLPLSLCPVVRMNPLRVEHPRVHSGYLKLI